MHPEVTKDTDKEGQVVHRFHYGSLGLPVPTSIQCQCSLTDASGQTWSGTDSLLVHPASEYLGLKVGSNFVMEGKDFWVGFPSIFFLACCDLGSFSRVSSTQLSAAPSHLSGCTCITCRSFSKSKQCLGSWLNVLATSLLPTTRLEIQAQPFSLDSRA